MRVGFAAPHEAEVVNKLRKLAVTIAGSLALFAGIVLLLALIAAIFFLFG